MRLKSSRIGDDEIIVVAAPEYNMDADHPIDIGQIEQHQSGKLKWSERLKGLFKK